MAKTMVTGFKRLPRRAYLSGDTSRVGSRTHFQLATFSGLMRTPDNHCILQVPNLLEQRAAGQSPFPKTWCNAAIATGGILPTFMKVCLVASEDTMPLCFIITRFTI